MQCKFGIWILCAVFALGSVVEGQSKYGGGSKPSPKPPSSSSKYGGGSKPAPTPPSSSSKYGGGSKPAPTPPSSASKYSGGSSKPSPAPTPKYSGGSSKPSTGFSNPNKAPTSSSSTKSAPAYSSNPSTPSGKPPATRLSEKARSNNQEYSKRIYAETHKATAPPRSTYTTSTGKTVNVQADSKTVKIIRDKPSTSYTPERRAERYETHVHNHHYSHPYNWYSSQPTYYVGGGYSSSFWWMMSEWSAERRAAWFYHNQHNIERDAYERGLRDSAVAAEVARLRARNEAVNSSYVDLQFADNPDLMYDQKYVEAAYNPTIVPPSQPGDGSGVLVFFGILAGLAVIAGLVWLIFVKRWE